MRIFKTKQFNKFAEKAIITDTTLIAIAREVDCGEGGVDLGGNVYKLRFARSGAGKSGGYRIILFFRKGERLFFEYAYPKSKRDNIDEKELRQFKRLAKTMIELTDDQIAVQLNDGRLLEIQGG
jgi:hypothetical protein